MNAILYSVGQKYVTDNTFCKSDLHQMDYNNLIEIKSDIEASNYTFNKTISGLHTIEVKKNNDELQASVKPSFFGSQKYYNIFCINFHDIKDQIQTKRNSWGNLNSFLSKHIQKLIESDSSMQAKKETFEEAIMNATKVVLKDSKLDKFISSIKINYKNNLRNNNCIVDFGLPDYEEIFLQMIFKIALNCDNPKPELIPISQFGDGYISMFVMAIIQAIAENNLNDRCLFLFEEPESFLHENHQDYFYKMVLCGLAEKGHQVIYTTHSDRMVDIFDTKGIIRLEFDETNKQTEVRYNDMGYFSPSIEIPTEESSKLIRLEHYNSYIKSIEPNLNKILFSRKVLLVEGPNDLMAYKFAIERKVKEITNDVRWSQSYLSFLNIAIIAHHGKSTALLLIELCKHIKLDFFVVNDADIESNNAIELSNFTDDTALKASDLYRKDLDAEEKAKYRQSLSINWKLIKNAGIDHIHFNVPKLEGVLECEFKDKSSVKLWNTLKNLPAIPISFFPQKLEEFFEIHNVVNKVVQEDNNIEESTDDYPF